MTRRDMCHLIGKRAAGLSKRQAARAWFNLAEQLMILGEPDIPFLPKFDHLKTAIRWATIHGKRKS